MSSSDEEEERVKRLAKDAERETRSLEKDADELGDRIEDTRGEWMRMRRDKNIAGAAPPEDDEEAEGSGENEGSGDAADPEP
jgi:hypothetical protein